MTATSTVTAAEAAEILGVSVWTVRRRCRTGQLQAVKNSRGHWAITLPNSKEETVGYTKEQIITLGGREWRRGGHHRVYLDWHELSGLEVTRYRSGGIRGVSLPGHNLSNSKGGRLAQNGKVWLQLPSGELKDNFDQVCADARLDEEIPAQLRDTLRRSIAARLARI